MKILSYLPGSLVNSGLKSFVSSCRWRHYFKNMDSTILQPLESVRGLTVLNKELFRKKIRVPGLMLKGTDVNVNKIMPIIKTKLLKMAQLKPVQELGDDRLILLHPLGVQQFTDLPVEDLKKQNVTEDAFDQHDLELTYDNWRTDELLKCILPADQEQLTSFSRVGHIIHLNLRDHLLPYKHIIAEIIRDKIVGIRTVVNKAQTIDNTYRNFQLELLIGDPDYQTTVKENGVTYEFNFESVYWNPRLSMEHERIVKLLKSSDVLYDVFAGVGPFAVPAGKKGCQVFANDLNPESFKWLQHNVKKNKVGQRVQTFNKDGREFIQSVVKEGLLQYNGTSQEIHIVMNLPALATTFLDAFVGLLKNIPEINLPNPPIVHVYCFTQCDNNKDLALNLAQTDLGVELSLNEVVGVHFVRSVAPNKDMMRVDFKLTPRILSLNSSKSSSKNSSVKHNLSTTDDSEPSTVSKRTKLEVENDLLSQNGQTFKQQSRQKEPTEAATTESQSKCCSETKKGIESVQTTHRDG